VLLDLVPGIAGRQVIVLPNEAEPSPLTIMQAIARYNPDAVTLTLTQATALLETPAEASALVALRNVRLLVADTHPIPHAVRHVLAERVARLDISYILPEAGDVVVL
jgi:acyl-coenzyme A synthetase/AMP-(fatty) acid ligase